MVISKVICAPTLAEVESVLVEFLSSNDKEVISVSHSSEITSSHTYHSGAAGVNTRTEYVYSYIIILIYRQH